jgi:hypothetical protein
LSNSPPGGFPQQQGTSSILASRAAGKEALAKAAALGVDIAPGIFGPMGLPQEAWDDMAVMPGDAGLNQHLYQTGRRDARVWAQLTGLSAAAAARRAGRARGSMAVERAYDTTP